MIVILIQFHAQPEHPAVRLLISTTRRKYRSNAPAAVAGTIHAMNDTSEQMVISFQRPIKARAEGRKENTTVSITFDYSLRPGLEGLYRSQVTGNQ